MPITDSSSQAKPAQKIELKDFMEKNFKNDMSMSEFAQASGRSLSTFKRDFKKFSELSPERWITARRLTAAYDLLRRRKRKFGITPGDVRNQKSVTDSQN